MLLHSVEMLVQCEEDGCMMKITGVDWYYHLCSHGILTKL